MSLDALWLQLRKEAEAEEVRTARNVVLLVGPRGGFRSLRYESYRGDVFIRSQQCADRVLLLFRQHDITVRVEVC